MKTADNIGGVGSGAKRPCLGLPLVVRAEAMTKRLPALLAAPGQRHLADSQQEKTGAFWRGFCEPPTATRTFGCALATKFMEVLDCGFPAIKVVKN